MPYAESEKHFYCDQHIQEINLVWKIQQITSIGTYCITKRYNNNQQPLGPKDMPVSEIGILSSKHWNFNERTPEHIKNYYLRCDKGKNMWEHQLPALPSEVANLIIICEWFCGGQNIFFW